MAQHIAVHGTGAIADNDPPFNVRVSYTSEGAIITPPAGLLAASFPYSGKVYFVFQSPPIKAGTTFNITGLTAEVVLGLCFIENVDMHSGAGAIISVPHPPPNPVDVSLKRLSDANIPDQPLSANLGLSVTYTVKFNAASSYAHFQAVDLEYTP
jgi:hypothetical protein